MPFGFGMRFFRKYFPCCPCCQTPTDQCNQPKCIVAHVPTSTISHLQGYRIDTVVDNTTFHNTTKPLLASNQDTRSVKFICISDTHGQHDKIKMPTDPNMILIHTGDFSSKNGDIEAFNTWLGTLPYVEKIVIAGNHEIKLPIHKQKAQEILTNATHYVCDNTINVRGVVIFGSPHHPKRGCCYKKEAFGANSSERVNVFNKVQSNTHIILSHCPPYGIRDEEFLVDEYEHVGCAHLLHAIEKIQPIACIFGHCHQHRGASRLWHDQNGVRDRNDDASTETTSSSSIDIALSEEKEETILPSSVEVVLDENGVAKYCRSKSSTNNKATLLINAATLYDDGVQPPIILEVVMHCVHAAERELVGLI